MVHSESARSTILPRMRSVHGYYYSVLPLQLHFTRAVYRPKEGTAILLGGGLPCGPHILANRLGGPHTEQPPLLCGAANG